MYNNYAALKDKNFLYKLNTSQILVKTAKVTFLSDDEQTLLDSFQLKIISGSLSLDGKSPIRRTCSLQTQTKDIRILNYEHSLHMKFSLEIGLDNNIDSLYPNTIWFPLGTYICTSFVASIGQQGVYQVSLAGKDKMCLLNGELGGTLTSSVNFGEMKEIATGNDLYQKVPEDYSYVPSHYYYKISHFIKDKNLLPSAKREYYTEDKKLITVTDYKPDTYYYYDNKYVLEERMTPRENVQYYTKDDQVMSYKIPIKNIITNLLSVFGSETPENIIVNDLDINGLMLLEYRGPKDMYLSFTNGNFSIIQSTESISYIDIYGELKTTTVEELEKDPYAHYNSLISSLTKVKPPTKVYLTNNVNHKKFTIYKIKYGDTIGYQENALVYPDDLIVQANSTITSVLDKIIKMLGEYEYFYNVKGQFVFQLKPSSKMKTSTVPFVLDENNNYTINLNDTLTMSKLFSFSDLSLFASINQASTINKIKNDFSIWGKSKANSVPIHMREAIDKKPKVYTSFNGITYATDQKYLPPAAETKQIFTPDNYNYYIKKQQLTEELPIVLEDVSTAAEKSTKSFSTFIDKFAKLYSEYLFNALKQEYKNINNDNVELPKDFQTRIYNFLVQVNSVIDNFSMLNTGCYPEYYNQEKVEDDVKQQDKIERQKIIADLLVQLQKLTLNKDTEYISSYNYFDLPTAYKNMINIFFDTTDTDKVLHWYPEGNYLEQDNSDYIESISTLLNYILFVIDLSHNLSSDNEQEDSSYNKIATLLSDFNSASGNILDPTPVSDKKSPLKIKANDIITIALDYLKIPSIFSQGFDFLRNTADQKTTDTYSKLKKVTLFNLDKILLQLTSITNDLDLDKLKQDLSEKLLDDTFEIFEKDMQVINPKFKTVRVAFLPNISVPQGLTLEKYLNSTDFKDNYKTKCYLYNASSIQELFEPDISIYNIICCMCDNNIHFFVPKKNANSFRLNEQVKLLPNAVDIYSAELPAWAFRVPFYITGIYKDSNDYRIATEKTVSMAYPGVVEPEDLNEPADVDEDLKIQPMLDRAEKMISVRWIPLYSFHPWNQGGVYYRSGHEYQGMPYSMSETYYTYDSWLKVASLNTSNYSEKWKTVYGSCCADFVYETLGMNKAELHLAGDYHSVYNFRRDLVNFEQIWGKTSDGKKPTLREIRPGDALSSVDESEINGRSPAEIVESLSNSFGHIVWVGDKTDTSITIYEQTNSLVNGSPKGARKNTYSTIGYDPDKPFRGYNAIIRPKDTIWNLSSNQSPSSKMVPETKTLAAPQTRSASGSKQIAQWHAGLGNLSWTTETKEAQENFVMGWSAVQPLGWSLDSYCAVWGNVGYEGGYNPWSWEDYQPPSSFEVFKTEYDRSPQHGYGLIGFTPFKDYYGNDNNWYINSKEARSYPTYGPYLGADFQARPCDGDAQLRLIDAYGEQDLGYFDSPNYGRDFHAFKTNSRELSLADLTSDFMVGMEKPASTSTEQLRINAAIRWKELAPSLFNKYEPENPISNGSSNAKFLEKEQPLDIKFKTVYTFFNVNGDYLIRNYGYTSVQNVTIDDQLQYEEKQIDIKQLYHKEYLYSLSDKTTNDVECNATSLNLIPSAQLDQNFVQKLSSIQNYFNQKTFAYLEDPSLIIDASGTIHYKYSNFAEKIMCIADSERNYIEKTNSSDLDDLSNNTDVIYADDASGNLALNFTKYAEDLDNYSYYTEKCQGKPWNCTFIDWCFYAGCEKDFNNKSDVQDILYRNPDDCENSLENLYQGFFDAGKIGMGHEDARLGDIAFIKKDTSKDGTKDKKEHFSNAGIVVEIGTSYIYIIEGDSPYITEPPYGKCCVSRQRYDLDDKVIFARPNYKKYEDKYAKDPPTDVPIDLYINKTRIVNLEHLDSEIVDLMEHVILTCALYYYRLLNLYKTQIDIFTNLSGIYHAEKDKLLQQQKAHDLIRSYLGDFSKTVTLFQNTSNLNDDSPALLLYNKCTDIIKKSNLKDFSNIFFVSIDNPSVSYTKEFQEYLMLAATMKEILGCLIEQVEDNIIADNISRIKAIKEKPIILEPYDNVIVDWRELIYQMAKDYYKWNNISTNPNLTLVKNFNTDFDYFYYLYNNNKDNLKWENYSNGTNYEKYYSDILGFWRELYFNPSLDTDLELSLPVSFKVEDYNQYTGWHKAILEAPETLHFWFDFFGEETNLYKFSVQTIGDRTLVLSNDKIHTIANKLTPDIIWRNNSINEHYAYSSAYQYFTFPQEYQKYLTVSAQTRSALDELKTTINTNVISQDSLNVQMIPFYNIMPNDAIDLSLQMPNVSGTYNVDKISMPLNASSLMQVTLSKITDNIV